MSFNACGDCTVCCSRFEIEDVFWQDEPKPRNTPCEKLCADGCSVYENRPTSCRGFKCIWLNIKAVRPDFPERYRPDQSGIMAITREPENDEGLILLEEATGPDTFDVTNMTTDQSEFVSELAVIASKQDIPTTLLHRSYDWKIMKINIEIEEAIS